MTRDCRGYHAADAVQQDEHTQLAKECGRNFWASTENESNKMNAWNVNLNNGNTNNNTKSNTGYYARCVRGQDKRFGAFWKRLIMVDDLPLYVACFELVKYLYLLVDHYPKNYKYSLGGSTLELAWQLLDEVMAANVAQSKAEKLTHIETASLAFDQLKTRLRMAREVRLLDDRRYGHVVTKNGEIGKMLAGWRRWAKTTVSVIELQVWVMAGKIAIVYVGAEAKTIGMRKMGKIRVDGGTKLYK